jgi:hypothetical protein
MQDMSDREYYLRREAQCRALADAAQVPEIRAIHLRMAEDYEARAAGAPRGLSTFVRAEGEQVG